MSVDWIAELQALEESVSETKRGQVTPTPEEQHRKALAASEERQRSRLLLRYLLPPIEDSFCRLPVPKFPFFISEIQDLPEQGRSRDEIYEAIRTREFSLSPVELRKQQGDYYKSISREKACDPCKEPDLAAYHFVNAYVSVCSHFLGVKFNKGWNPLTPTVRGRTNPVLSQFGEFLADFCRQGLTYPHGWVYFRLQLLMGLDSRLSKAYGKGQKTFSNFLLSYTGFLYVLNRNFAARSPKRYQPFNRGLKGQFALERARPYTQVGFKLSCWNNFTLNFVARENMFSDEAGAEKALKDFGYVIQRDQMLVEVAREKAKYEKALTEKLSRGEWVWEWPWASLLPTTEGATE